jgi:hypothetical protein
MANEPISALTLFTSYSIADEIEILDVSDTTFASTGTNKRIPFSTLLTMAGVGTVAGGGSGTVTSVGLSLPPFITVGGSPVSTTGTLTGTLATQTADTHFAGPTSGSAAAPTFRALVAADLPSITYGAIQNESASTILGNPTGSPASPSEIGLYPNLGFVGSSLRGSVPIWAATGPGTALVNSTVTTSLLTGALAPPSIGSLTIPANTLQVGTRLRFWLFGSYAVANSSSPKLTVTVLLGGQTLASYQTVAPTTSFSGYWLMTSDIASEFIVQSIGATGKIIGVGAINLNGWTASNFTNNGASAAMSQVTINTTGSLALDLQLSWSYASSSNTITLLGGAIYLD